MPRRLRFFLNGGPPTGWVNNQNEEKPASEMNLVEKLRRTLSRIDIEELRRADEADAVNGYVPPHDMDEISSRFEEDPDPFGLDWKWLKEPEDEN